MRLGFNNYSALTELLDKVDVSKSNIFSRPAFLTPRSPMGLFIRASMEGLNDASFPNHNAEPTSTYVSVGSTFSTPQPHVDHTTNHGLPAHKSSTKNMILGFSNPFNWKECTAPGCKEGDSVLTRLAPSSETQIQVIEWNMMDMKKFYPLSMVSSFFIRCVLYPLTLVKTKIQVSPSKLQILNC